MTKTLIYAGIGSRKTPEHVLDLMADIGRQLGESGWTLRSGHADGADSAFEAGALVARGNMEIYLPWKGFNEAPLKDPRYIVPLATDELAAFTARFHPAWDRCTMAAQLLHMRNSCQMLGITGDKPADAVICWTPEGRRSGGTGQALRIAEAFQIPIFDLGLPADQVHQQLVDFIDRKEMEPC